MYHLIKIFALITQKWPIHVFCTWYIFNLCEDNSNFIHPIHRSFYEYTTMHGWLLIRTRYTRYTRREIQFSTENTKSRIRYTWYNRPGTNHPHHLGTDVTFFLLRPQHLTQTLLLINMWFITSYHKDESFGRAQAPVSYTHLTLPTIYSV